MIVVVTPHFIFKKSIEKYDNGELNLIDFSRHNDQSIYSKIEEDITIKKISNTQRVIKNII
ncbi:hypothetical protein HMPREF2677_10220 [Staphylococcus sp. HMSC059G05]|nr:hypothetical protein HMPREF2677_10220 [Staphylococcus sp. HMSC059G05]